MSNLFALLSGLIFGIGLLLSGMANPAKVQAFLDITRAWDPSLAFVMGGAIAVASLAFAIGRRRERAWSGVRIEWPLAAGIDARLLGGGALFGIGWGLAGFCPGPALVALSSGMAEAWIFSVAMVAGMLVHDRLAR